MDPRVLGYLDGNRKWAGSKDYVSPVNFKDMQKKGRERDDGTVIVIACTDPRVTPEEFLGMSTSQGNKATIIRVAGGRVEAAMSSLLVLSAVGNLGKKGVIMVIHHTDCGLASMMNDEEIREVLLNKENFKAGSLRKDKENAKEARELVKKMKFGSIAE